ncbi:thioesterase II family protein [Streptomyces sp. NPDC056486]|uniref:thioesterase II family protein n=1 Tax=Streptomyces sp. NPDC056486 TaxID=3345835 RepID=UPI0036A29B19
MLSHTFPLVCLPFAGSGAGFYRAWTEVQGQDVKVLPVQLPGREELFLDAPFTDAIDTAKQLAPQVVEITTEFPAFGLFGHSLGAVLCYEIARELKRIGHPGLTHLYVSGSPGPWNGRDSRATGLNDDEFVERVQEFAGYRHAAFDNPDLRELLLPVLRADVAMHENYKPSSNEPLGVPVTSLRGEDDALVSKEHAQQWGEITRDEFRYVELPGGHMYLAESAEALLRIVAGS